MGSRGSLVTSSPPLSSPSFRGAHASSIQRHFGAQVPPCPARQLGSTLPGLSEARQRHKLVAGWAPSSVYIPYSCNILYILGIRQPPVS